MWVDDLCNMIAEKLSDVKKVKFNTHKNRKLFIGELTGIIKDAINKNTNKQIDTTRRSDLVITRPNPNKTVGHSIMTPGDSQKGDELLGVGPNSSKVIATKNE